MFRHAIVVCVAVLVALGAAQQMARLSAANALARTPVQGLVETAATPGAPGAPDAGAAQVVKAADGHYWAEAEVDGRWIHCLIDTGATAMALTRADAARLGLDPAALTYDQPVNTANGQTRAARVQLPYVSVAGARVASVPALVVQDGLPVSLLGMSYLGKLSRFEATPTSLILRP